MRASFLISSSTFTRPFPLRARIEAGQLSRTSRELHGEIDAIVASRHDKEEAIDRQIKQMHIHDNQVKSQRRLPSNKVSVIVDIVFIIVIVIVIVNVIVMLLLCCHYAQCRCRIHRRRRYG